MPASSVDNQRRGNRTKAVLPVRLKGTDSAGTAFDELAITLDVTPSGVRLGSVRRELKERDLVTIHYRQRRLQCRVVWTRLMKGTNEFQVGLQSVVEDREAFGLTFADFKSEPAAAAAVQASGA